MKRYKRFPVDAQVNVRLGWTRCRFDFYKNSVCGSPCTNGIKLLERSTHPLIGCVIKGFVEGMFECRDRASSDEMLVLCQSLNMPKVLSPYHPQSYISKK
jgi:hypothetical protein